MITVVIGCTRAGTLPAAVASLQAQTLSDWEVVIVAQGEDPAFQQSCRDAVRDDVRFRIISTNQFGLSRARNIGLAAARHPIIAFTDDDCEATPGWLETIAKEFNRHPDAGVVSGALIAPPPPRGTLFSLCPYLHPSEAVYRPSEGGKLPEGWDLIGANFAIHRTVCEQIGFFDEQLGAGTSFGAAEETDYKLRMERAGIEMVSTPRSIIHHTYGRREGLKTVLRLVRAYSRGNGALAAKLTLMGDPRGAEWLRTDWHPPQGERLLRQIARLPIRQYRRKHFQRAYYECLASYSVEPDTSLLVRGLGITTTKAAAL